MSWLQWRGETWPVTADDALLAVHFWCPNAACPTHCWSLSANHTVDETERITQPDLHRHLCVEINELHVHPADWRQLAGLEIRADPAWQEAREYFTEYGRLTRAEVTVQHIEMTRQPDGREEMTHHSQWIGEDFHLRFGTRDGSRFPCELDAWLMPDAEWRRTGPEMPGDLALSAAGPPTLRLITSADFRAARVGLPRCGDDPTGAARRRLREELACTHLHPRGIEWALRDDSTRKLARMPGWTSTVAFRAEAGAIKIRGQEAAP